VEQPYVLSCFVALREKNLPFETRIVALQRGAQHEAAFVGASLTARVPVLVDGALSFSESSAIVEYLEDRFPAPGHARVLPEDIGQRARADLAMMLWRLSRTGYSLPEKVRDFADAEWERPSVREFVGKPRPSTFVAY
jgi:glutathione S-transferase